MMTTTEEESRSRFSDEKDDSDDSEDEWRTAIEMVSIPLNGTENESSEIEDDVI